MSDREFIELLNLYVDREISAEDARRLEVEVAKDARRRDLHDQYCRMQKACSKLSEETYTASLAQTDPSVVEFPAYRSWRVAPFMAGMAAAAVAAVAYIGVRDRLAPPAASPALTAAAPVHARPSAGLPDDASAMKPVFYVRPASDTSSGQLAQLNWIGDIRMSPVISSANADFLLTPRADLKAAVMADPQAAHDSQEPVEMTAFRFQR
jgi:hypothetical protein